jgi:hypothetical protein
MVAAMDAVARAQDILRTDGPQSEDGLIERLRAEGFDVDDPGDVIDPLESVWWLGPDLLIAGEQVAGGGVFTHRLTEAERQHSVVTIEPDLTPLTMAFEWEAPLVDGGALKLVIGRSDEAPSIDRRLSALAGPTGWLDAFEAGDLIGFAWEDGSVSVRPVAAEPAGPVPDLLADAFARRPDGNDTSDVHALVADVVFNDPKAFAVPRPPLGELLSAAGLDRQGGLVAAAEFDWDAMWAERRAEYAADLADRHGLDDLDGRLLADLAVANITPELDDDLAERAAVAFTSPDATMAFLTTPLGPGADERSTASARRLAEAVVGRHPDRPPAGASVVLGRLAEEAGDVTAHVAATANALEVDPTFRPALEDAAMFAADRGDARRALVLLDQIGGAIGERRMLLEHFAGPGRFRAGRNDPCPCGSGRKHKACCGPTSGHPLADRAMWLFGRALSFARRTPQLDVMMPIFAAAQGIDDTHDDVPFDFGLLAENVLFQLGLFEGCLLERFLDVRGQLLPADERELATRWVGHRHRLWTVDGVADGIAELLDPESRDRVRTPSLVLSDQPEVGQVVFAIALPDGEAEAVFGDPFVVPPEVADDVAAALAGPDPALELASILGGSALQPDDLDARLAWLFPDAALDGDWAPDDETLGELVEDQHPELADAVAEGVDEVPVEDGHLINPRLHLALHEIAARQILDDEPAEMWTTARRLDALGYDRHEVLHMLASTLSDQIWSILDGSGSYDPSAHVHELAALPESWTETSEAHVPHRRRGRHPRH